MQKKWTWYSSKHARFCSQGNPFSLRLVFSLYRFVPFFFPLLMSLMFVCDDFLWHRSLNKTRAWTDRTAYCWRLPYSNPEVQTLSGLVSAFKLFLWCQTFCVHQGHMLQPACPCSDPLCSRNMSPDTAHRSKGCWNIALLSSHRPSFCALWGNTFEQNLPSPSFHTIRIKVHHPCGYSQWLRM